MWLESIVRFRVEKEVRERGGDSKLDSEVRIKFGRVWRFEDNFVFFFENK